MAFDKKGFYRQVGLLLQLQRRSRNLTQEEVAEALGVSRATYANVERGRQTVALDLAWKAAVYFGVPMEKITPEPLPPRAEAAEGTAAPSGTAILVPGSSVASLSVQVPAEA